MKNFFDTLRSYSIITIIASLIFGVVLLIFPVQSIAFVSIAIGAVMLIMGIVAVIDYFVNHKSSFSLAMGIIVMIFGVVICSRYKSLASFVTFMFGLFLIFSGVIDLGNSLRKVVRTTGSWIATLVLSIVSIVFGIIAVVKPFTSTTVIIRLIGVGLLVYSVMDILAYIQIKNVATAVEDAVNLNSEVVDDNARIINDDENED